MIKIAILYGTQDYHLLCTLFGDLSKKSNKKIESVVLCESDIRISHDFLRLVKKFEAEETEIFFLYLPDGTQHQCLVDQLSFHLVLDIGSLDRNNRIIPSIRICDQGIAIINADYKKPYPKTFCGERLQLITYGLNSKSSITASSIQLEDREGMIQFCLQRDILDLTGKQIESQESTIYINEQWTHDIHLLLAVFSTSLVCGFTMPKEKKLAIG